MKGLGEPKYSTTEFPDGKIIIHITIAWENLINQGHLKEQRLNINVYYICCFKSGLNLFFEVCYKVHFNSNKVYLVQLP